MLRTSSFIDDVICAHNGPRGWRHVDTIAANVIASPLTPTDPDHC